MDDETTEIVKILGRRKGKLDGEGAGNLCAFSLSLEGGEIVLQGIDKNGTETITGIIEPDEARRLKDAIVFALENIREDDED